MSLSSPDLPPDDPLPLWKVLDEEYCELDLGSSVTPPDEDVRTRPPAALESRVRWRLHDLPRDQAATALCLSGGGIRSAAFGLGVLQGLAAKGLLSGFHYLSTVSGGGYIGSWLSSWIHRHWQGRLGVEGELRKSVSMPAMWDGEPHPVQQLRRYSNYLSPRAGLFSSDTWTLLATFIRNLLANWLVLVPWLMLFLLLPRLVLGLAAYGRGQGEHIPLWLLILIGFTAAVCLLFAIKYSHDPDPPAPETSAVAARKTAVEFLWLCLIPTAFCAVLLVVGLAWYAATDLPRPLPGMVLAGALFGGAIHYLGWFVSRDPERSLRYQAGILFSGLLAGAGGGAAGFLGLPPRGDPLALAYYVWLAPAGLLFLFVLGTNLYTATAGTRDRFTDADMEWYARMGAKVLRLGVGWLAVVGVVFFGPVLFDLLPRVVSLAGVATLFASSVAAGWSGSTESGRRKEAASRTSRALELATAVAGPLLLLAILAWLSGLTSLLARQTLGVAALRWAWTSGTAADTGIRFRGEELLGLYGHLEVLHQLNLAGVMGLFGALLLLFVLAARWIALNKFSLHHMYRERLIRGFLGASRRTRRPDPFTGFDPADNLPVGLLWPMGLDPARIADPAGLARAIRDRAGPVAELIRARLGADLMLRLRDWSVPELPPELRDGLLNQLTRGVVEGPLLGIVAAEPKLPETAVPERLRSRWRELRAQETVDSYDSRRFNRMLLELTFGRELRGDRPGHGSRPFHLINLALNLSEDPELAWQDRKAESFTVSPLHAGSGDPTVGYRRTDYPAPDRARRYGGTDGISLGTAMAISGAAASPNMGYHSSPVITLLLTLFNTRLGWWLGNPGKAGEKTYHDYYVRQPVRWLLRELRGKTNRTAEYVYLSDGGHFENLGVYEALRRRCRYIVVSDAGCDPEASFEDLGNAIRKARIDFGVSVEFELGLPMYARPRAGSDAPPGPVCPFAVATIRYGDVDHEPGKAERRAPNGLLLYLKPALAGDEPIDVRNYAVKHPEFPHETTADQWFSEAQFESYRALGLHTAERALAGTPDGVSLGAVLEAIRQPPGRARPPV